MATSQSITESELEQFRQLPLPSGPLFVNETGKVHGDRTVICFAGRRGRGIAYWVCRCKCGQLHVVRGNELRKNRSCNGCGGKTHGGSQSPEYRAWNAMSQRCVNRKLPCWNRDTEGEASPCVADFANSLIFLPLSAKNRQPSSRSTALTMTATTRAVSAMSASLKAGR